MIEREPQENINKKEHRRRGGAFDTIARVLRDVQELVFRSGVVVRNRVGSTTPGSSPSRSVFEMHHQEPPKPGEFNMMFFGRSGLRQDYNTNYIELTSDIKPGDTSDPSANGQVRLQMTRDGVEVNGLIAAINSRLVGATSEGVRVFIHGSGSGASGDLGGVQMVYIKDDGSHLAIVLDRDGVQIEGLPTSDPGGSNRLWSDGGTIKIT